MRQDGFYKTSFKVQVLLQYYATHGFLRQVFSLYTAVLGSSSVDVSDLVHQEM